MTQYKLEWLRYAEEWWVDIVKWTVEIWESWNIIWNVIDKNYPKPQQDILGDLVKSVVSNIIYITQDTKSETFFGILYILTKKTTYEANNTIEWWYDWKYYKIPRSIIEELRSNSWKLQTILSQWNWWEDAKITLIKI